METQHTIALAARDHTPAINLYSEYHCQTSNTPRDTIIMLPGGPGNDHSTYNTEPYSILNAWLPYADVLLFDPRGCGKSDQCEVHHAHLNHYVDDVEAIRQYFNISPDRFIVFGQSYGALAATTYACRYPKQLKKLLLIGALADGSFLRNALDELRIIGSESQQRYIDIIWNGKLGSDEAAARNYIKTMGSLWSTNFKPEDADDIALSYNSAIMNYGFANFLKSFDIRPELHNIICPTRILWGEDEWIFSRDQVEQVHRGIANSELITYTNASHLLWVDQWQRFVKDSADFIQSRFMK